MTIVQITGGSNSVTVSTAEPTITVSPTSLTIQINNQLTITQFLSLSDTPSSYSGSALKHVRVNAAANALEFAAETGEANTASNVGAGGVGLFKQKTGVDLEFKKINAGSSKITVNDDTGNSEVDLDVAESNLHLASQIGAPSGAFVGTTDPQTLTNKVINFGNAILKATANGVGLYASDGTTLLFEFDFVNLALVNYGLRNVEG